MLGAILFAAGTSLALTTIVWLYDSAVSWIHASEFSRLHRHAQPHYVHKNVPEFDVLMMPKVGHVPRSSQNVQK